MSSPAAGGPPLEPGTVGAAVGKRGVATCLTTASLADVADLLIETDHSAVLAVDSSGNVQGAVTENDLLNAFVEGVSREAEVGRWLRAGDPRLPRGKLPMLTVESSTPLVQAAIKMRQQRGGEHACHHLLVKAPEGELFSILSAMDIVRALVALGPDVTGPVVLASASSAMTTFAEELVGDTKVAIAMKTRAVLPECPFSLSVSQCFREMFFSKQNCVVVVDDGSVPPGDFKRIHGVITPRDLLRAFSEHASGDTTAERWLRGTRSDTGPRTVAPNMGLLKAAEIMATLNVHHLVVVEPGSCDVQGVLSCLDVACVIGQA